MCSLCPVVISVAQKGWTLIAYTLREALCWPRYKPFSLATKWICRSKALTAFFFVILRCVVTNKGIIRTYSFKITHTHYNHFQNEKSGPKDLCLICKITYLEILQWYKIKSNLAMHLTNQGLSGKKRKDLGYSRKSRTCGYYSMLYQHY